MRSLRLLMLALAASLIFAACPADEDDEGATILLGDYIDQVFQVESQKLAECEPAMSSIYFEVSSNSLADVKVDYQKSIAANRLAYHADKAGECLQQTRAASCDVFGEYSAAEESACDAVFEPKVAPGGDCYMDSECIGGFCASASCPGKCVAYAKANESCASLPCDPDLNLYCDSSASTAICLATKAAGADCAGVGECQDGLECSSDGKCVAIVKPAAGKLGETCGEAVCAEGLYCNLPESVGDGTCAAVLAVGDQCGATSLSAYAECGVKAACAGFSQSTSDGAATQGKCAPWMDVGGACTAIPEGSMGLSGCKHGLACQGGKCVVPPATGACLEGTMGFSCDPRSAWCDSTSQCVAKKADGAACVNHEECQNGACIDGKCFVVCHP